MQGFHRGPPNRVRSLKGTVGLSAKVMNVRLREMLRFGIVSRNVFGEKPPVEVDDVLTPFGRRFMSIIDEIGRLQEAIDRGPISESAVTGKEATRRGRLTSRLS